VGSKKDWDQLLKGICKNIEPNQSSFDIRYGNESKESVITPQASTKRPREAIRPTTLRPENLQPQWVRFNTPQNMNKKLFSQDNVEHSSKFIECENRSEEMVRTPQAQTRQSIETTGPYMANPKSQQKYFNNIPKIYQQETSGWNNHAEDSSSDALNVTMSGLRLSDGKKSCEP
jgi:hypothetical protein